MLAECQVRCRRYNELRGGEIGKVVVAGVACLFSKLQLARYVIPRDARL